MALIYEKNKHLNRVHMLYEYYKSRGYDVCTIEMVKPLFIDSFSIQNIFKKREFFREFYTQIENKQPDCIHCMISDPMYERVFRDYKENHEDIPFIVDVVDFEQNLDWDFVDFRLCSCALFQNNLFGSRVLYDALDENIVFSNVELRADELEFCLLEYENTDISLLLEFLRLCVSKKPCTLHVFGNSCLKEQLIQDVLSVGVNVVDHKVVTDLALRQEIFDQCHYGLNIIKEDVYGILSSSLEFMSGTLPIINSSVGDLSEFCRTWKMGLNLNYKSRFALANAVCSESVDENLVYRKNIKSLFSTYFTKECFYRSLDEILGE